MSYGKCKFLQNLNTYLQHVVDIRKEAVKTTTAVKSVKIYTRINVKGMGFEMWSLLKIGPMGGLFVLGTKKGWECNK